MKLTFCGANRTVTGSCHMITINGKNILVDCGMRQGRDEVANDEFPFTVADIHYVVVTHAHIDHSGRLPLLYKQGFNGAIIATRLTAKLLDIMLRDSAHIQESDAAWENQKGKRAGREPVEPLYTLQDAEGALSMLEYHDYNNVIELMPGVTFRFIDAGHLLGSAYVEFTLEENGEKRVIVFSGDIGNKNQPIIKDPQYLHSADYVVMESTYGDRDHEGEGDYTDTLANIMDETFANGGNVIIPSFAVGRTQELLYSIRRIKEEGMVQSYPEFAVYVDSPLAKAATEIYAGELEGYIDEEAQELAEDGISMFMFPGLSLCESTDESKQLNLDKRPKVIISASGMCDAGRIRHHLKHNLWRKECTVAFVGFQVEGSLGRMLLDGRKDIKLFGEEINVKANIVNLKGMSGHADRTGLLNWIDSYTEKPRHVFVVHGDAAIVDLFTQTLREKGYSAHGPDYTEEYDLLHNVKIKDGYLLQKKKAKPAESIAFTTLRRAGEALSEVINANRHGTNKDLAALTKQITDLVEKWKR